MDEARKESARKNAGSFFSYQHAENSCFIPERPRAFEAINAKYPKSLPGIEYGKRLPNALYIIRPRQSEVPPELWAKMRRGEIAAHPDPTWNLLKIHTDQFGFTFLSYPDFDADPHPALAEATKINLSTGSILRTDYRTRANLRFSIAKKPFCRRQTRGFPTSRLPRSARRKRGFTEIRREQPNLHVFANWPMNQDAAFGNLNACGGFLVSSAVHEGRVDYVQILSQAGEECRLVNPWPG